MYTILWSWQHVEAVSSMQLFCRTGQTRRNRVSEKAAGRLGGVWGPLFARDHRFKDNTWYMSSSLVCVMCLEVENHSNVLHTVLFTGSITTCFTVIQPAEEASNKMSLRINRFWDLRHRVSWSFIVGELGQWKCGRHELFFWWLVEAKWILTSVLNSAGDGVMESALGSYGRQEKPNVKKCDRFNSDLCRVDSSRSCHIFSWDGGWFISAFGRRCFCSPGFWKLPSRSRTKILASNLSTFTNRFANRSTKTRHELPTG